MIEALLWFAPLVEAQNPTRTSFTFSLCDFLLREIFNLKRVMQHWRTESLQEAQEHYYDEWEEPANEDTIQLHQICLKEDAEARGRNHLANGTVNPNTACGRTRRTVTTFHYGQQKKDGESNSYGSQKRKEIEENIRPAVNYLSYIMCAVVLCFASIKPNGKGKKLLSVLSFLPFMSLNGAQALPLDDAPTDAASVAAHKGFYLLQLFTPSKALFIILVAMMLVVYLLLCFWLSVGWLHFAKRLLFGAVKPYRKEDGNDLEAGGLLEEDSESELEQPPAIETRTVSSMQPGMMIDFKFKTNVLSDALVEYSRFVNVQTLRSILFDRGTDEEGDDCE